MSARPRIALLGLAALLLAGCERAMHDMYDQPKDKPLQPSALFDNHNSARVPPAGAVVRSSGAAADESSGRAGTEALLPPSGPALPLDEQGRPLGPDGVAYANPLPPSAALLQRGRERFDIYCAPCHGRSGYGDGMVVRRGFPAPPSYHTARLRQAPDSHFYQVITQGYGVMYPYAARVSPHDRWAIVAYIRALQLSQHAPRDVLTAQDLARLDTPARASSSRPPARRERP